MSKTKQAEQQRKSWFVYYGHQDNPKLISQIFFRYNSARLDDQDKIVLDNLAEFYKPYLEPNPALAILPLEFEFFGFADHRGTPNYNMALGKKRAKNVRDYVYGWLGQYRAYSSFYSSRGEHYAQHKDTASERRVDIYSSRTAKRPVFKGSEVVIWGDPKQKSSTEFSIKTRLGSSIGIGPVAGQGIALAIRNLRTNEVMEYTYTGVGVGLGIGFGSRPSDETKFTTPAALRLGDFEGNGKVTSISVGVDSAVLLEFRGPVERGKSSKPVVVETTGWDISIGTEGDIVGYFHRR